MVPHTYGEDRVKVVVLEERVGGQVYEDWGDGTGHFYGTVLNWDPRGPTPCGAACTPEP